MTTQFHIPAASSAKDRVIASPFPKERILMNAGKHIFYASVPSVNLRPDGKVVCTFRNHIYRTDDSEIAKWIKAEYIDRQSANLIVESIKDDAALNERMKRKAVESMPAAVDEGKITPLPNQGTQTPPPPLSTGMQNSQSVNLLNPASDKPAV